MPTVLTRSGSGKSSRAIFQQHETANKKRRRLELKRVLTVAKAATAVWLQVVRFRRLISVLAFTLLTNSVENMLNTRGRTDNRGSQTQPQASTMNITLLLTSPKRMGSQHNTPAGNSLQHRRPHSNSETVATRSIAGLFPGSHDFQINNCQLNDFSRYAKEGTCECRAISILLSPF